MPEFVSSLLRLILKLALGLMAVVFAVSLLAAALVVLAFSLLKALITGKRPAPAMVFNRFRAYAPQDMWPGKAKPAGEVVDLEVRELHEEADLHNATEARPAAAAPSNRRPPSLGEVNDVTDVTEATDVTDKKAARPADAPN